MCSKPPQMETNKNLNNTNSIDRLSSLPEHLLSDIISLLPTDSAVATSVLSHHWHYLWTSITRFNFNPPHSTDFHTTATTVENILQHLNSPLRLHTFYLRFHLPDRDLSTSPEEVQFYTSMSSWLHRLCGPNTEKIEVSDSFSYNYSYYTRVNIQNALAGIRPGYTRELIADDRELESMIWFPECLFRSETLVELILSNTFQYKLPDFVVLPNLKKLSLRLFESYRQLMTNIFKSLPLLEDLSIFSALGRHDHLIDIAAPNLKIFAIEFMGPSARAKFLIDAPKLEQISIVGYNTLIFRFVKIPTALFKAKLVIMESYIIEGGDPISQIMSGLLKGISGARSLVLALFTLDIFDSVDEDDLPSFDNLVHLSFDISHINFMKKLAIPGWMLRKAKTIDITCFRGCDEKEIVLLEHILSNASALELLRVFVFIIDKPKFDSVESENATVKALFMLPRDSARCEIKYDGVFVSASTNDFDNQLHA